MTDRERLLEQVKSAESNAETLGRAALEWIAQDEVEAAMFARRAAHYGLTALALRELVEFHDEPRGMGFTWGDAPHDEPRGMGFTWGDAPASRRSL